MLMFLALSSRFIRWLRLFCVRALRQAFEDAKAFGRPSSMLPTGAQEAAARIALVAGLFWVNVSIKTFPRPAFPGDTISFTNQIARQSGSFIAENSAVDSDLIVHRTEFAPDKQCFTAWSYKNGLFAGASDQVVIPIPLIEKTDLGSVFPIGVVSSEQFGGRQVTVFDNLPQETRIRPARARRQPPSVPDRPGKRQKHNRLMELREQSA